MTKKALLVGINYPRTQHELRGCVNDVHNTKQMLQQIFGFDESEIKTLTDEQATTLNIKQNLLWLVEDAKPGDVLFFHYSGHGSQMVNQPNDQDFEPDGLDEVLVPIDMDWRSRVIKDDDLKQIFDLVPPHVNLTVLLDCCHSGGGLDQKNQYQPLGLARLFKMTTTPNKDIRSRYLEPPSEVQAEIEKQKHLDFKPKQLRTKNVDDVGLLISGCQSHQTSADAKIKGQYVGACTYFLIDTVNKFNGKIEYLTLISEMNRKLKKHGYTQRPELNGSSLLFNRYFLYGADPSVPTKTKPQQWFFNLIHSLKKSFSKFS